ncbi:MAG: uracil-DNA glycosylase [Verrucomicrobiota bacterium]
MRAMPDMYEQLLDATIQHLEELRTQGTRFVQVSPDALAALGQKTPLRRPSAVAPAKPAPPPSPAPFRPAPTPAPIPRTTSAPLPPPAPIPASAPNTPASILDSAAKATALAALREKVLPCVKCPGLASSRKNVVFGVGNFDADLMFVGEAPGVDEDQQGEPFVGAAGQLLNRIIATMGLAREQVYIANILKCRPDTPGQSRGNRKPTAVEMQTCIPYLHQQVDIIRPKILVALGGTALEGLLGKTGISRLRGTWHTYRGIPLMPTYHPSYLLHQESLRDKRLVWEDMLQVMEKLGLPISEKQRRFFLKSSG